MLSPNIVTPTKTDCAGCYAKRIGGYLSHFAFCKVRKAEREAEKQAAKKAKREAMSNV